MVSSSNRDFVSSFERVVMRLANEVAANSFDEVDVNSANKSIVRSSDTVVETSSDRIVVRSDTKAVINLSDKAVVNASRLVVDNVSDRNVEIVSDKIVFGSDNEDVFSFSSEYVVRSASNGVINPSAKVVVLICETISSVKVGVSWASKDVLRLSASITVSLSNNADWSLSDKVLASSSSGEFLLEAEKKNSKLNNYFIESILQCLQEKIYSAVDVFLSMRILNQVLSFAFNLCI